MNNMPNGRIAVLGAAGEIGARLVLKLMNERRQVRAISRSRGARLGRWPSIDFHATGMSDEAALEAALRGCDAVVNCYVDKGLAGGDSALIERNLKGCMLALKIAQRVGVRRFIQVSSIAVLPPKLTQGALENELQYSRDSDWYTQVKVQTEKLFTVMVPGIDVVVVRPGIVYGPYLSWSRLAFRRAVEGAIAMPEPDAGICHAVHVDDLTRLLVHCADADKLSRRVLYGVNPEILRWTQYFDEHARVIGQPRRTVGYSQANLIAIARRPTGVREIAKWAFNSPLIPESLRNSAILGRLAGRARKLPAREISIAVTNSAGTITWPTSFEIDLFQSDAIFASTITGGADGFEYSIPFTTGVKSAGDWWNDIPG
ncbi:NAD-dependent epimerase/dehydratase family protein [Humisphaera borealis]|uniref:NAD-dependent epimerase/dehydratase family protein n=1 Tax=Humisphaera borealis TaxID=2807512 RepID=A0A7M2X0Z0_9BACT|nr:NAD-dependent epimerase/dehydratase family protein [Humisphaera borealis]QOV91407.1 NAD-dependent epimerase/dehydratase family protein [Humisphaera borealis]